LAKALAMSKSILLHEISENELEIFFSGLIRKELERYRKDSGCFEPEELMTRSQAAAFLKIDLSTITAWTARNRIPAYSILGRRYYKKHELLLCLEPVNEMAKESQTKLNQILN
jgi:excisionase family DNA binding protein